MQWLYWIPLGLYRLGQVDVDGLMGEWMDRSENIVVGLKWSWSVKIGLGWCGWVDIFFHLRDKNSRKDIRDTSKTRKDIKEKCSFFQKWLEFNNVLQQNGNKIGFLIMQPPNY